MDDVRSNKEKMLAGELYLADDPELVAEAARARRLMAAYAATDRDDAQATRAALIELVGSVGTDVSIRRPFYVDYGSHLTIGDRVFANYGLTALDCAPITIGNDVQIGPYVQLLTPTHPVDADQRRSRLEAAHPISIGDNVWLGGGVIVLAGVSIGENAVIGAGSVVVHDIPANVLAVGSPAKTVREL